jgi:flagellar biosynthesis GTPase FlhF
MTPTETEVIDAPEVTAEPLALQLVEQTNSLAIVDEETKQRAGEIILEAKARIRVLETLRKEEKAKILEAGRDCDSRWNARMAPYQVLVEDLAPKLADYLDAERKRAEEAQRIANEAAEKERLRIEALARENERKAQEAREAEEKARRDAEAARAAGDAAAAKAAEAEAAKMAKAAERQEAKADLQTAQAATVPVFVPPPPAAVAGMSAARPWKATCTDLEALLQAAVNHADPTLRAICRGMLKIEFSQQAGNRQAAMTKTAVKVPGVTFAQETSLRGRG